MTTQTITKRKKNSRVLRRAHALVVMNAKDLKFWLYAFESREDLRVLGAAWNIANARGEKTKAVILESRIKKLRKEFEGNDRAK